jgi:hypothetical protein
MTMDNWISQDTEVAMLQRVFSAYQRIAKSVRKSVTARRSAPLYVVELEERATPAAPQTLMLPIHPPETLLVAVVNPIHPPVANADPASGSVRSDLFGVGDAGKPEHSNELEEMLANKPVPQEVAVAVPKADDSDAGESVIIEDMVYLPYVD